MLYQGIQAAAGLVQVPIHGVGLGEQIVGFRTFVGIVGAVEKLLIQLDRRAVVHILVGKSGGHGACQVQQGQFSLGVVGGIHLGHRVVVDELVDFLLQLFVFLLGNLHVLLSG